MSHDTPVTDPRHMDKRSNEHIRCFRTGLYKEAERLIKGGRYEGVFLRGTLELSPFDCSFLLILSFICRR